MKTYVGAFSLWLLIGGLWLIAWPLLQIFQIQNIEFTPTLVLVASFPHFALSYFLFCSQKGLARRHRFTAFVAPSLMLVGLGLVMFNQAVMTILLQVAYFSFFHHLGKQAYGVSVFYSGEKLKANLWWKRSLAFTALSWAIFAWTEQQSRSGTFMAFKSYLQTYEFPVWIPITMAVVASLSTLLTIALWWRAKPGLGLGPATMAWTPLAALITWCIPQLGLAPLGFIPIAHGLQYMPFGWIKLKDENWKTRSALAIFAISIAIGWALFQFMPRKVVETGDLRAEHLVAAFYVFLNVHHYLVDRCLWKREAFKSLRQEAGRADEVVELPVGSRRVA